MKTLLLRGCFLHVLLLSVGWHMAGCTSDGKFYREVASSRQSAYRRWKAEKERDRLRQPRVSGELPLRDCLKLALSNNKFLQGILLEKEIARGERVKSYSAILPTVGLTGDYQRLDEVSSFTIGNQKITMGIIEKV